MRPCYAGVGVPLYYVSALDLPLLEEEGEGRKVIRCARDQLGVVRLRQVDFRACEA